MPKSYSKYIIGGLAIIPVLWIISRVVMLHLRPATPEYQQQAIAKQKVGNLSTFKQRIEYGMSLTQTKKFRMKIGRLW